MNRENINHAQQMLLKYCQQRKMTDIKITGIAKVSATNAEGKPLHLTVNLYGDIMDAEINRTIADGNTSHNIMRISEYPTKWTDRKESVLTACRKARNAKTESKNRADSNSLSSRKRDDAAR
ncbi:hypothetical protein [Blautia massiliensis (ex Durand et al. 2017)]|uniref:hypothetical protein n=1 Tax=Lachnospiraceae TaxID=186803 RepID=UPI00242ABD28|nr:hypothetical protein [Blautia massiliensis (ex Durand et al. 2017)]MDD6548080.1 hypothetical protein [Blautia massiliensis (ex Durand et al. 2017)]